MLLTYEATKQLSPNFGVREGQRIHCFRRGEEIPLNSQGVWQVCRGAVQLVKLGGNGEETVLGWVFPSNFFGMWLTQLEVYQARALSDVYLGYYTLAEIKSSVDLSQIMLEQVVRRMRQTEALLAIAGLRLIEDRLQELLSLLKQEMGTPVAGATRLNFRLTHENISKTINTTRVTVTRILGDFQRQGLISLDSDRHLIISF
jgi:CRP-like cAMP-binding protein